MKRRDFLRLSGAATAGVATGCVGGEGGRDGQSESGSGEKSQRPDHYRIFFEDKTGTLGDTEKVPEDVDDWQVVKNTLEEDEWTEKQLNDWKWARREMNPAKSPNKAGVKGNPEDLKNLAINYYEDKDDQDEDKAVRLTESIIEASLNQLYDVNGAVVDNLVPNIAEWVQKKSDVNIPEYKLSTIGATITLPENLCKIGHHKCTAKIEDKNSTWFSAGEFSHPMALLQYEEKGEAKTRYIEIEPRPTPFVMKPEESIYSEPMESDRVVEGVHDQYPEHAVTSLEYEKARQMQQEGILRDNLDMQIFRELKNIISDVNNIAYDEDPKRGLDWPGTREHNDKAVSDSFGKSITQYVHNPSQEGRENLEHTARKIYTSIKDNSGQREVYFPMALAGTIEEPEIIKTTNDKIEEFKVKREYSDLKDII